MAKQQKGQMDLLDFRPKHIEEITKWAKEKVGQPNVSFVLMRKSTGNTALPPAATFGSLEPILESNERFKLDACAQVG